MELVYLSMKKDYIYLILNALNNRNSIDILRFTRENKLDKNEVYNAVSELAHENLIIATNKESVIQISMKGKMYFYEYKKLKNETWISRWKKNLFFPTLIASITFSLYTIYVEKQDKPHKHLKQKTKQSVQQQKNYKA